MQIVIVDMGQFSTDFVVRNLRHAHLDGTGNEGIDP
jgi:hypothetical protein